MHAKDQPKTVLMLADLDGQRTAHSALENYTTGAIQGFLRRHLRVIPIDSGSRWIVSNLHSPASGDADTQRMRRRTVLSDHVTALRLAVQNFKTRKDSTLFVINVARSYIGVVWLFKVLGFRVVYWVLDYYPNRSSLIKWALGRFSDLSIFVNSYVASLLRPDLPVAVFQGGTTLQAPSYIKRPGIEEPMNLFYAGTLNKLNAVDQLLEVAAKNESRFNLELFGGGELATLAEQYAAEHPNISMRGLASRWDVLAALRRSDVAFCVRRLDDGYYRYFFPSKLAELLASPVHIIASDMAEVTAPFKGALIFCNSHHYSDIVDALDRVRAIDPKEEEACLTARDHIVREVLNWDRLADLVSGAG